MSTNTILASAPLTSTGYHLKANGTTLGNSLIWDNGTNVGIGNQGTTYSLDVTGSLRNTTTSYLSTSTGIASISNTSPTSLWQGQFLQVSTDLILGRLSVNGYSYWGHNVAFNGSAFKSINGGSGALIGLSGAGGFNIDFASGAAAAGDTYPTYATKFALTNAGAATFSSSLNARSNLTGTITAITTSDASGYGVGLGYVSGGYGYVTSQAATSPLALSIDGNPKLYITTTGNVLIGTTSDGGYKLKVNGEVYSSGSGAALFVQSRDLVVNFAFFASSDTALNFYSTNGGTVGNFNRTTGIYTPTSDINKKKDFEESKIGLDAILGLKPTLFRMKLDDNNSPKQLGFIAQEVKEFIPQAYVESDEMIGLSDRPIIAALVKGMQEQQAQIEELKAKIDELKNK